MVTTENGANLDYMDTEGDITPQHYAFLTSESEFDEIFGRVRERELPYWADPDELNWATSTITTAGAACTSRSGTGIFLKLYPRSSMRQSVRLAG